LRDAVADNALARTLTIFWLHQIYFLILSFRASYGSFPEAKEFDAFLQTYPDLMYGRLWTSHYSKDLLFSPEAKETWRLPDLEPLPQFMSLAEKEQIAPAEDGIKKSSGNASILKRFAYAILKTSKSRNRRRAAVINETLPVIQSHLVRLRAKSPQAFEPYSETQAYFWIQMLHAAVESMPSGSALDIGKLSFESFTILFPELLAHDDVWTEHYSPARWNSIEARMQTILPDLKPLPNVLQAPDENRVKAAVSSTLNEKYSAERDRSALYGRPSVEELFMEVRWAVKQTTNQTAVKDVFMEVRWAKDADSPPETHTELIRRVFDRLVAVDAQSKEKVTNTLSTAAWDAVSFLHEGNRFTHAVLWSQMVLGAFTRMDASFHTQVTQCRTKLDAPGRDTERTQLFSRFLSGSPELCWDGLWRLYYSDEVWRSADAGRMYILPDKRKIPAYVDERNAEPDAELGDWEWVDTMGP
jgi:ubiquitin carboxyl-terminal hydrolase L3